MIQSKQESRSKPQQVIPARADSRCPDCGEISYSRAGIHPQCSVRQADEKGNKRIKREKLLAKEKKTATPGSGIAPWQTICPMYNAVQHVRKTVCGCDHVFSVGAGPPTCEGERT